VGVSYGLNKKNKKCYIKSLGSASVVTFDTSLNLNNTNFNDNDWFAFKLKSPESLLLLDSTYIYIGKRVVNNILCDIYMSNRSKDSDIIYTEFAFADVIILFFTFGYATINLFKILERFYFYGFF